MKQKEVDFNVKSYLTKGDYEKDGCPVQYFEFDKHEYYGLIAVQDNFRTMSIREIATTPPSEVRAFFMYVDIIAGSSLEEIRNEGYPRKISESEALLKFLLSEDNAIRHVSEVINEFKSINNGAVLVDSSLI